MKITKARLRQMIKEEIDTANEERMIELSLTQKEANDLLIALEAVEQTPEIIALYDKIFDAGLGGGFGVNEASRKKDDHKDEEPLSTVPYGIPPADYGDADDLLLPGEKISDEDRARMKALLKKFRV